MPGLRDLQSDHRFGIAQFTTSGCQPLLGVSAETDAMCVARNRAVLSQLSEIKPQAVLLNALWRSSADELKPTIDALRAIGVTRIVILGRVPVWEGGLPNLVAVYYRRTGELLPEWSSLFVEGPSNDDAIRLAADRLGIAYISLREPICRDRACQTRVGSDLMVSDWLHFTPGWLEIRHAKDRAGADVRGRPDRGPHRPKNRSLCHFRPGFCRARMLNRTTGLAFVRFIAKSLSGALADLRRSPASCRVRSTLPE